MKANELMIGDIVKVNNTPLQIAALGTAKVGFVDAKGEMFYHYYDNIEPIPLTAEILEKNGFTIHLSHCGIKWLWLEKQKFELAIDEENGNKITTAFGLIDIEIKYVHELQHALKLCGIEKDIQL